MVLASETRGARIRPPLDLDFAFLGRFIDCANRSRSTRTLGTSPGCTGCPTALSASLLLGDAFVATT